MTDDAASLYRQWWAMLPSFFAAMQPAAAPANAPAAAEAAAAPDWFSFIKGAPDLANGVMTRLFDIWAPMLGQPGAIVDGLRQVADATDANVQRLREAWSGANPRGPDALPGLPAWPNWATPMLFAAGGAVPTDRMNPLQAGADRTFGAFADAIGARPLREMQETWQVLARAEVDRRAAQAAYLGMLGEAWSTGTRRLIAKLDDMRQSGEQVTSMLALLRLWAREADAALHAKMQSQEGLAATAQVVRASTGQRAEVQRLVALVSSALNVPTRAEVDDSFREIQELKREIRRLKKGTPSADDGQQGAAKQIALKKAASRRDAAPKGVAKTRTKGAKA